MAEVKHPLVTLALFAYNQSQCVGAAVDAALSQDYSPLEIILSDDCSSDGTFEIMENAAREYKGPHLVTLNRNSENLNIGGHVNKIGEIARGELIVTAAGDDISMPNRVSRLVASWCEAGKPSAVLYSDMEPVDQHAEVMDLGREFVYPGPHALAAMAAGDIRVLGATTAVSKNVFKQFPPLSPAVRHEDRVLPFRALLLGGRIMYLAEKLVKYRAVNGASRQIPKTMREYLRFYTPSTTRRILPDAVQRLSDALFIREDDIELRHACEATIADHESRLDFHNSSKLVYEFVLFRWVFRGARLAPLLKHYVKLRTDSASF